MACETTPAETGIEFDKVLQHSLCRLGVATITPKPIKKGSVLHLPRQRRLRLASHGVRDNEVLPFVMQGRRKRGGWGGLGRPTFLTINSF